MKRRENMAAMLKQLFPSASPGEMKAAGGRVLKRLQAEAPESFEAFRFRSDLRTKAQTLGRFDQLVLTAIVLLRDEAYLLRISQKIAELTSSKEGSLGRLYVLLDGLEEEGWITTERRPYGKYARKYCALTESGKRLLAQAAPAQQAIEDLGHFA